MANPQGVVNSESVNTSTGRHVHSRSHFPDSLSYRKSFTARFGEYVPSFEMEGVPTDSISLNSSDKLDSMSLKAPFKGTIRKIKESFSVPNMAILPYNWDRIYTQPSNGDDVPVDANCVLGNFPRFHAQFWRAFYSAVNSGVSALTTSSTADDVAAVLNCILRTLVLGEYIYSNGSLPNVTGYKISGSWRFQKSVASGTGYNGASYDTWFDAVIAHAFGPLLALEVTEPVGSSSTTFRVRGLSSSGEALPWSDNLYSAFRFLLEKFRENPTCWISAITLPNSTTLSAYITRLKELIGSTSTGLFEAGKVTIYFPDPREDVGDITSMSQNNFNISRILAYQLVCAHYYSNSAVDFIYTAELYRQYVHTFFKNQYITPANAPERQFSWNGMDCPYDFLSEHYLARSLYLKPTAIDYVNLSGVSQPTFAMLTDPKETNYSFMMNRLACYAAIFGFRKSLRFGDYFVGSRPRPLAPVNTDVAVNNNLVSVIDITRNIQAQRFANAVMRSRSKIEEYVKSLFGNSVAPDYHNPFFLSRETEVIYGDEVQNTGAAQQSSANSRTALWSSQPNRFTFTFKNDDSHPCIYLQIVSFDIKRSYTRSTDRQFLHADRYDMFNPDFQFIGDQPIYGVELGYIDAASPAIPFVFGYQSRDMEYKQRFDVASGGFVENLPGWLLTDQSRELYQLPQLNPDFIRSFSVELDQFYLSLTGYSLGSYFHFAIITENNVDATRPMSVDPQILE